LREFQVEGSEVDIVGRLRRIFESSVGPPSENRGGSPGREIDRHVAGRLGPSALELPRELAERGGLLAWLPSENGLCERKLGPGGSRLPRQKLFIDQSRES